MTDFASIKVKYPLNRIIRRYAEGERRSGGRTFWLCPFHKEKTPSFSLTPDGGAFVCFGCGEKGDVFDFIAKIEGLDLKGAVAFLERNAPATKPTPKPRTVEPDVELKRRIEAALKIWREAGPVDGTPVDDYLRNRGITIPTPPTIKHHPNLIYSPTGNHFHGMVAAIQATDRRIVAIHRTYLLADGRKAQIDRQRMMLGPCGGNTVRLAAAGPKLALSEGIENGLSFMEATGIPTWAALSAGNLSMVTIPDDVRELVIVADGEDAGREAANQTADRWIREGLKVRIVDFGDGFDANNIFQRGAA